MALLEIGPDDQGPERERVLDGPDRFVKELCVDCGIDDERVREEALWCICILRPQDDEEAQTAVLAALSQGSEAAVAAAVELGLIESVLAVREKAIAAVRQFIEIGSPLGVRLLLDGRFGRLSASTGKAGELATLAISQLDQKLRRQTLFNVLEALRPYLYEETPS